MVDKHKAGMSTLDEYFRWVVKITADHNLPASYRTFAKRIENNE